MPDGSNCVAALLAAFATTGALVAQDAMTEAARRATFVRVVDGKGAAIAGAVVTFVGCVPWLGLAFGPSDTQHIGTDERGRAQARLQGGLCYVTWAVGPADAEGRAMVSPVTGFLGAGSVSELVCDEPRAPVHVTVTGLEAWRDAGPLRFHLVTSTPGTETELELRDGRLELPPSPQAMLEVRTADGQPLWSVDPKANEVVIPPPQRVHVSVHDERGAPVAGAAIRQRIGRRQYWRHDGIGGPSEERLRELGATGDDGTALVVVCHPVDPLREARGEMLLFASAPGRPPVAGGVFGSSFYVDDRRVAAPPGDVLKFTLRRVEPLIGNCGRVPEGTVAHLHAVCRLYSGNNAYHHDARAFVTPVSTNGAFVFDGVPAEIDSTRLTLIAPEGKRALPLFPTLSGRDLPPEVAVRAGHGPLGFEVSEVQVRVLDATGGPARGAVLCVVPGGARGVLLRDAILRCPLDSRGVASLSLAAGPWSVLVVDGEGWAAAAQELGPGPGTIELAMQPLARMHVRLRDKDGAPISGASVLLRGTTTRSSGSPLQALLQAGPTVPRVAWSALRTDGDGRIAIRFVPVEGVVRRVQLRWDGGSTADFELVANEAGAPGEMRPK